LDADSERLAVYMVGFLMGPGAGETAQISPPKAFTELGTPVPALRRPLERGDAVDESGGRRRHGAFARVLGNRMGSGRHEVLEMV